MVVGPHELAVSVEEMHEDPIVFSEGRRIVRDREAVGHVDRLPMGAEESLMLSDGVATAGAFA